MNTCRQGRTTLNKKRKIYVISSSEDEESEEEYSPGKKQICTEDNVGSKIGLAKNAKNLQRGSSRLPDIVNKSKIEKKSKQKLQPLKKLNNSLKIPKLKLEVKKEQIDNNVKDKQPQIKVDPNDNNSNNAPKLSNKLIVKQHIEPFWQEHEILASEHNIDVNVAKNIVTLFKDGNTIPFIARYRKNATGQMTPDELRNVKTTLENTVELKQKIITGYNKIHEMGKMNDKLSKCLLNARNVETFDEIYAPYKPVNGQSSIKQKIHTALEDTANSLLDGKYVDMSLLLGKVPGLDSIDMIKNHLSTVIAKKIATSPAIFNFLQKLKTDTSCKVETKKINKRVANQDKKDKAPVQVKSNKSESNFIDYYDRMFYSSQLKPHQILAINRAEHLKFINVKFIFRDFSKEFYFVAEGIWKETALGPMRIIFESALQECYTHVVIPLLKRLKRAELKLFAEKASLDIFSGNLKQILLAPPTKGRKILGIDPGFKYGCKLALISDTGCLLATTVVYPHSNNARYQDEKKLKDMLVTHNCSLIALGNGKACRQTEAWLSDMIHRGWFQPLEVSYTIVNESGASVYSCSEEAQKEFKTLDPNIISAVSLARRIQDPLAELVKIHPKHLGIGMYQHDVNQKRLEDALSEVVSECVSFVGIDINTASQCLLKSVAGLSDRRAAEIIAYREKHGTFQSREELLKVKGIGPHTFKQCAGFLKIRDPTNKLDATIVHPESYDIAINIVKKLKLELGNIGEEAFISTIKTSQLSLMQNANKFNASVENLETILEGLSKPINYDMRHDGNKKPLFRKGVTSVDLLQIGMVLTGGINNVTSFGYFVDIGVGTSGLIHIKNSKNLTLQIGDHVEVRICNLDISRGRIGLELMQRL